MMPRHTHSQRCESAGRRVAWSWLALMLLVGCTFETYVPKEPPPPPLAESEANIQSLSIGEAHTGELNCPEGRCRVRYRFVSPGSGKLRIIVDGPVGDGPEPNEPRIARVVLQGISQQNLAVVYGSEIKEPPFVVASPVMPGVHWVLIQALGGEVGYTVSSSFEPDAAAVEPGDALGGALTSAPTPPPVASSEPVTPGGSGRLGSDRPGNTSDGADYAYDPTRHDLFQLRRYTFAQDPAAMLKGAPGSVQGNAFILRQIQREVRYTLADMQFEMAPADEAQLLVSLHTSTTGGRAWYLVNDGIAARPYQTYMQQWNAQGGMISARTYEDGVLVINFIDAKNGELLWHGWTVEALPLAGSDDKVIKSAVKKVLAQF
jgi:hypothetical protein